MTKAKKRVGILVCIAVLVLGTAGATMAYFTDSDQAVNTFTVGKVEITLDEADVNLDGTYVTDVDKRVDENKYHLIPGSEYVKDPTVHVVGGSEDCYLYVKVENGLDGIIDDSNSNSIEDQMEANGWAQLKDNSGAAIAGIYCKEHTKSADIVDYIVFEEFKVDGETTKEELAGYGDGDAAIKVTAYAVQKAGFDTAFDAWKATFGKRR